MAEYIEREALLNKITSLIKKITPIEENRDMFYHDSGWNVAITAARIAAKNEPAADVAHVLHADGFKMGELAPVRHGRWGKSYKSKVTVNDGYVSSCCDMWNERKSNYCPNCGAVMDGET